MKKLLPLLFAALVASTTAFAQLGTTSPTGTLTLNVAAEGGLTVNTAATPLIEAGTNFSPYTGTTSLTYFVRTSSGGGGSVVLRVTTDFTGAGGPSVASPPTAGDALTYTCTVSAPGTACAGPLTASTLASTNVAIFGNNAHSTFAGNSASVSWSLTNDPVYLVGGPYVATVTYTISAT